MHDHGTCPIYPVSAQTTSSSDKSLEGRPAELQSSSRDEIVGEEVLDHEEDAADCAPRVVAVDPGPTTEKEVEAHIFTLRFASEIGKP